MAVIKTLKRHGKAPMDFYLGGELYSTVGVETPIEAGGHPYQIK